jgi:hypothetical protein
VIRLEDGKIVADEERGYYLAAGGDRPPIVAEDLEPIRSRNGLGTNPLFSE